MALALCRREQVNYKYTRANNFKLEQILSVQYNAVKKLIDRHYKSDYNKLIDLYKKNPNQQNFTALDDFYIKLAYNINNTIINICKKEYGKFDSSEISRYGQTNQAEFFAEVYANVMLSSNPTNIAKAMKKYLKERDIK